MGNHKTITIDGRDYYLVPVKDDGTPPGTVDAIEYGRASLGRQLREMREAAGLTQDQLAKRILRSQTLVAQVEGGKITVGEDFVAKVELACSPAAAAKAAGAKPKRTSGRRKTVSAR